MTGIDMRRWSAAFGNVREVVEYIEFYPPESFANTWEWIRIQYAASRATFSMMTADQQSQVRGSLEELRQKLEKKCREDWVTSPLPTSEA